MTILSLPFLKKVTEYSFYAAFFLLPFSIAGLEIFLIISFSSFLLYKLFFHEPLCEDQKIFSIFGIFITFSSVSAFYSGYPEESLKGILKLIRYFFIVLVAMNLFKDRNKANIFLKIALAGLCLVLADAIVQWITLKDPINQFPVYHASGFIRLTGPYKFSGLFAAHLIAILPLLLAIVMRQKILEGRQRMLRLLLSLFLFILSVYILYQARSRGAWLASIGGWIVYGAMCRNKWVVIALLIIAVSAPLILPRKIFIHEDIVRSEQSLKERYQLWYRAIQVIKKEPFFGCGINTYVRNYPKFDERKHWRVPGYYVHNGYLQLAAETGLIALALFLLILWMAYQKGIVYFKNAAKEEKMFIAAVISGFSALLLQAAFDTTLHNIQSSVLIWLFAGLLLAWGQIADPAK